MKKQTAVEWLIQNIVEDQTIKAKSVSEWTTIYKQTKAMEKEQIKEGYIMALLNGDAKIRRDAEDYYNKTYK